MHPMNLVSTQFVAGFIAIAIGLVDHWGIHSSFGLMWDQTVVFAGIAYLVGVGVPPPNSH